MSEKEHQFERIYKETENFGRTQFVREIQLQINDNKKKDKEIERLNNIINEKNKEIEDYSNKWCELAKAKTKSDNIINELEKLELYEFTPDYNYDENLVEGYTPFNIREYIQELKGSE